MERKRDYDRDHRRNLDAIGRMVEAVFDEAAGEMASLGASLRVADTGKAFRFADYPRTRKRLEALLKKLRERVEAVVLDGIDAAWTLSDSKNSELARRVLGDCVDRLGKEERRRYFSTNGAARRAFGERVTNGMGLSDRVWECGDSFRREMEMGIDLGISRGEDAAKMARSLRQYLRAPDRLFRRVRDERGQLHLSRAAADYHPGRGVYRSSYKNARRLAVTETNMAYHTADYLHWQDMDFVVGIEVRTSGNHTCLGSDGKPHVFSDICDELQGKYPKDFKFTGWHPHCRCQAVPILKKPEELMADNRRILEGKEPTTGSTKEVKEPPRAFNDWVRDKRERAKGWSTMPYFVKDNLKYVDDFSVNTYSATERKFTRAHRTKDSMREIMAGWLQAKYPEMPNTEMAAIYHYTRGDCSDFRQLNKQLREDTLTEFSVAFAELLSSALAKLPPVEMTTYRTVRLNKTNLGKWIELAKNGRSETFEGFTSTSESIDNVLDWIRRIEGTRKRNETDVILVINGKSGRKIEDFSQFNGKHKGLPNQQEVLFNRAIQFSFKAMEERENGQIYFYVTEM